MVVLDDIYKYLCELAPLELQMDFDNAGLQIGRKTAEIKKAVLALDVTWEVIQEAISENAELIISHHPLIFHPVKALTEASLTQSKLLTLAENKIAAISMHTNLDIAEGGVNDVLMTLLGGTVNETLDEENCGRVGCLNNEMPLNDFLLRCKAVLCTSGLRYTDAGRSVHKLAVMGGAGGDALYTAFEKGCDTFVTSDIKYHQFLDAKELGINLIDADHFGTENPIIPHLADKLRKRFPDTEFIVSRKHRQCISFK